MDKYSFLGSVHISFYDKLYNQYLENPDSVDASWRSFFQGYDFAHESYNILPTDLPTVISKEFQVISLIDDFRKRGHLFTKTNPVRDRRDYFPKLNIENFNLTKDDLDTVFQAGNEVGLGPTTLSYILRPLRKTFKASKQFTKQNLVKENDLQQIFGTRSGLLPQHVRCSASSYSARELTLKRLKLCGPHGIKLLKTRVFSPNIRKLTEACTLAKVAPKRRNMLSQSSM